MGFSRGAFMMSVLRERDLLCLGKPKGKRDSCLALVTKNYRKISGRNGQVVIHPSFHALCALGVVTFKGVRHEIQSVVSYRCCFIFSAGSAGLVWWGASPQRSWWRVGLGTVRCGRRRRRFGDQCLGAAPTGLSSAGLYGAAATAARHCGAALL